jgi:nucleotide-binding universal stress UspA family protein
VSAEVVDDAPCPVLVARQGRLSSVLVADDHSASARRALAVVESWPIFRAVPISVLSVSEIPVPLTSGYLAAGEGDLAAWYQSRVEYDQEHRRADVAETVARLRARGLQADGRVEEGPAAATIVAVAERQDVDLIVVGSRGQTGLARLVLGSVARNVVHHSHSSVLVVREAEGSTREPADT